MDYSLVLKIHIVSVILFLLIYLVKTSLLLFNAKEKLSSVTKITKVPEMIISVLFLATGVYMLLELPEVNNLLLIKIAVVVFSIPIAIIGFKRGNKVLATLAFLMIVAAYGLAEMSKKRSGNEVALKGGATTPEVGKAIYEANCMVCHGEDGKKGAMGATDLTTSTMSEDEIKSIIRNGKGAMPAVSLSDEHLEAVTEYVKILKK